MKLLELVHTFIEPSATVQIAAINVEPDPELAARNDERIQQAKEMLGPKYLFHPSRHIQRRAA